VLSHGKIAALIQPFEVMIIGGAAFGAFLQANPGYMTMHVVKKSLKMFGSASPTLSTWKCWAWYTRSSTRAAAKA
jgi:flagellar motor component MotA